MNNTIESTRKADAGGFNGTRKLVRPQLPAGERWHDPSRNEDPLSHAMQEMLPNVESSHAEAFYFQKQMQQQTDLTIVLEDGEQVHGLLEWYDRCALKLRAGRRRILIYKACVKYLYKTSDAAGAFEVMK